MVEPDTVQAVMSDVPLMWVWITFLFVVLKVATVVVAELHVVAEVTFWVVASAYSALAVKP